MLRDEWPEDRNWKRTIALSLVPVLAVAGLGYRVLTTAAPVSREAALERFRAEVDAAGDDRPKTSSRERRSKDGGAKTRTKTARSSDRDRASGDHGGRARPSSGSRASDGGTHVAAAAAGGGGDDASGSGARTERGAPEWRPGRPEEGVYSWATQGYESFSGNRRRFPSETQRIVTLNAGGRWTNHHYFSEERESWSQLQADGDGYLFFYQRNRIEFGPVTRDVKVVFDPPMRSGLFPARVGQTWKGSWRGPTYGSYDYRILDRTSVTIGGQPVDVWVMEFRIHLRGENEGEVLGRVWLSPKHHLTVREQYVQDVETGPGTYHAEWDMTLKSLKPER